MLLTMILIFAGMSIAEGIKSARKKMWKESIVILSMTGIGILLQILKIMGIDSPIKMLGNLIYPLGRIIFKNH